MIGSRAFESDSFIYSIQKSAMVCFFFKRFYLRECEQEREREITGAGAEGRAGSQTPRTPGSRPKPKADT